jgi:peptidoglycan/LPS O-acetylase OafA/YrhL
MTHNQSGTVFELGHRPALDGLRGISILAVLILHLNSIHNFGFTLLRGGFLGVDMFFVISGFLITSLLLEESRARGSVSLRAFYIRRALRLLPAVIAAIIFTILIGLLVGSFTAVGVTPLRLASTIFYFNNWLQSFGDDVPWFLTHFWSLSIEEQFYLVWPVVLLFLLKRRGRTTIGIVTLAIGVSCLWRAGLYWSGSSAMRLYHGSDTRADALLAGCLLSLVIYARILPSIITRHLTLVGRTAWTLFLLLLVLGHWRAPAIYVGGLTFAALMAAMILLHALIAPPAILSSSVLVWIGKRSYGLYVWHWPVYLLASTGPNVTVIPVAVIGTFLFAAASYRYIEKPFLERKRRHSPAVAQVEPISGPAANLAAVSSHTTLEIPELGLDTVGNDVLRES